MVSFYGDYDTTETVVIPFNSFTSDDPSASVTLTNLANTDIYIYKDGSLTQRTSFAGIAVDVDVDAIPGNHWVTIDLSDDTDNGFYVAGSRYQARMEGVTIDGATVNAWIGAFSIGCTLRPTTAGRTLDIQATGEVDANLTMIGGTAQRATDLAEIAQYFIANSAEPITDYVADDSLLAKALTHSGDISDYDDTTDSQEAHAVALAAINGALTSHDNKLDTVDGIVDTIVAVTGNLPDSGALTTIGTDAARLTAVRAAVLTDWIDNGRLDLLLDAIPTTAMRGTDNAATAAALSTHDGKLDTVDTVADGIKAVTDALTAAATAKLALSAAGIVTGAAEAGTLSTTQMTTNLTEATNDHYIGAVVVWTSGVLAGQRSDITDYAGANGLLTYTAVTEAPSATDTFVIL